MSTHRPSSSASPEHQKPGEAERPGSPVARPGNPAPIGGPANPWPGLVQTNAPTAAATPDNVTLRTFTCAVTALANVRQTVVVTAASEEEAKAKAIAETDNGVWEYDGLYEDGTELSAKDVTDIEEDEDDLDDDFSDETPDDAIKTGSEDQG